MEDDLELREALAEYVVSRPSSPKGVSFEEFLAWGDEDTWAEWVDGEVIVLSPASASHQLIKLFLAALMREFAHHHSSGEVLDAPFPVRLPERLRRGREPDIIFIRREQLPRLKRTHFDGSPDVIVEVVSPESESRDYQEKYEEYEAAGVGEYWLVDPDRRRVDFLRLGADGLFHPVATDDQGVYHSEAFPGFRLKVDWLWRDPPPTIEEAYLQELDGYRSVYGKGKDEGMREGLRQGTRDGILEGKQAAAREFLALRFGERAADILEMVKELNDLEMLNDVLRKLFTAVSLEEARDVVHKGLRDEGW